MKKGIFILAFILFSSLTAIVYSQEYKCNGERIEKNGSSWGYAVISGSDYRIEKGNSTIAYLKRRDGKWAVEDLGGSTIGYLNGSNIETGTGNSWGSLSDAKSLCDGPDQVAAAIWVLNKLGKL